MPGVLYPNAPFSDGATTRRSQSAMVSTLLRYTDNRRQLSNGSLYDEQQQDHSGLELSTNHTHGSFSPLQQVSNEVNLSDASERIPDGMFQQYQQDEPNADASEQPPFPALFSGASWARDQIFTTPPDPYNPFLQRYRPDGARQSRNFELSVAHTFLRHWQHHDQDRYDAITSIIENPNPVIEDTLFGTSFNLQSEAVKFVERFGIQHHSYDVDSGTFTNLDNWQAVSVPNLFRRRVSMPNVGGSDMLPSNIDRAPRFNTNNDMQALLTSELHEAMLEAESTEPVVFRQDT